MQKLRNTVHCFFNILKQGILYILLFGSLLEWRDLFCVCGATQALISIYIKFIKKNSQEGISTKKLIYNHHIKTNLQKQGIR